MSTNSESEEKLKIVSLQPKIVFVSTNEQKSEPTEVLEEEIILAPFLIDQDRAIENLSKLVDKVYNEFEQACENKNLKWEAELELGMELGIKFTAKLKLAPKS